MKICICITYDTSWLLSTVTLYGYVSHMINMFIDNLSLAPIALYHICNTAAVERQNHSLSKYMEICTVFIIYGTKCSEGLNFRYYSDPRLRNAMITVSCIFMCNVLLLIKVTNAEDVLTFTSL
jgi:hypothetical protein